MGAARKARAGSLDGDLHAPGVDRLQALAADPSPRASQLSRPRPGRFAPFAGSRPPTNRRRRRRTSLTHPQRRPGGREKGLRHAARGAGAAAPRPCLAVRPYRSGGELDDAQGAGRDARHRRPDRLARRARPDEVLEHYRRADLFALACRIAADGDRDGLPNVLVEAASQRLACVSTKVSGVPELLSDGATACWSPPDDPARAGRGAAAADPRPGAARHARDATPSGGCAGVRPSWQHRLSSWRCSNGRWQRPRDEPRRGSSSTSSICSASAIWRAPAASPRRCATTASR